MQDVALFDRFKCSKCYSQILVNLKKNPTPSCWQNQCSGSELFIMLNIVSSWDKLKDDLRYFIPLNQAEKLNSEIKEREYIFLKELDEEVAVISDNMFEALKRKITQMTNVKIESVWILR